MSVIFVVYRVYSVCESVVNSVSLASMCVCVRVQVVQSCDRMVSSGVAYMEDCRTFSGSVKELATHFEKGDAISVSVDTEHEGVGHILTESLSSLLCAMLYCFH